MGCDAPSGRRRPRNAAEALTHPGNPLTNQGNVNMKKLLDLYRAVPVEIMGIVVGLLVFFSLPVIAIALARWIEWLYNTFG